MDDQKIKASVIAPILITVLMGLMLLLMSQISGANINDPLYTDLKAIPLYAKNGFLPSYADLRDVGSLEWDLVKPPHGGKIVMADLPAPDGGPRYGRYSPAARAIEEFTIFIPFTLEKEAYQKIWEDPSSYPALYFAGIGENWEVFLNGHSIAKQIFLNASGDIARFRNMYNTSIPVSKGYLNEGENFLVIHIIGARSSKWTGLRYTSPYNLRDSSRATYDFKGIINAVMNTVFMFAGLYHIMIYAFRKTDKYIFQPDCRNRDNNCTHIRTFDLLILHI